MTDSARMRAGGHADRYAMVVETIDADERFSARFDAHWESSSSGRDRGGPRTAELEVALRWARSNAARVYVRTGEGLIYSAGLGPVTDEEEPPPLPTEGLKLQPRPQATHWRAVLRWPPGYPAMRTEVRRRLSLEPHVLAVVEADAADGSLTITCTVEATGPGAALHLLGALVPIELTANEKATVPYADLDVIGPA